ncbi:MULTISPECIES: hypothetical protein [Streptomyces]|uniref:Uncharacterized protein n=1 Tax=Streptomyces noursei TaxID=1971 RepID=A0A059WIX3_STRNR|nr:hypothetical protein [Streptomyces noursei]AKA09131.1 hypothetical protein SAZ_38135 [Streptomyces noursei ZPM]AIA07787.1 hypothetical protein DC74_7365 [Streptomyces noursei]EOS98209.1 hypothetical protein K530_40116 [Streptomyces noursei CCRC 11814]EXU89302.1 hypothetical protein P354_23620 [Streptomyces noursei PD-1]MCZ0975970.1 hypothetical protein [Streptomyces noursei]
MRIRAAIAASALAASIVLGGASTASAGGKHHHYGKGWYAGYSFDAAVINGNPIFHDGAHKGRFKHGGWK